MISDLRKLTTLREANKLWNKLALEQKAIIDKMSINSFLNKLSYASVRKVIKKEIWKMPLLKSNY
jgi:hypothetical protein